MLVTDYEIKSNLNLDKFCEGAVVQVNPSYLRVKGGYILLPKNTISC